MKKCFESRVLKVAPPLHSESKQHVKKQERDVARAERIGRSESLDESTDDEAADTINLTASGVKDKGPGKSTFYETSEEQHEALNLEAESVALFKIAAPPDAVHKVYRSVVTDHAADMALLEEEQTESGEDTADDQPGAMPGSGAGSSNDGDKASRAPAAGGMHALAKDWVVVKKEGRATQIMERSVWKKEKMASMIGLLPTREKALYMYGQAFGGDVLFGDKDVDVDCIEALRAIHSEFDGKLWDLCEEDMAPCVKSIPAEVLEPCSCDHFIEEYHRFRNWLQALKRTGFAR